MRAVLQIKINSSVIFYFIAVQDKPDAGNDVLNICVPPSPPFLPCPPHTVLTKRVVDLIMSFVSVVRLVSEPVSAHQLTVSVSWQLLAGCGSVQSDDGGCCCSQTVSPGPAPLSGLLLLPPGPGRLLQGQRGPGGGLVDPLQTSPE